jgi:epoxide hydrolase-like protein
MSTTPSSLNRRNLLGTAAAAVGATLIPGNARTAAEDTAVRPFRINIPDETLADLRRRLTATRWPDRETVSDDSQGVPLATMQELARHWATDYNWRKVEARLNALPQFMTEIDGLDIHFLHVRSQHENAFPSSSPMGGRAR